MRLRNSAKAIVIHEEKLLVTKLKDQDDIYYLLPGGGQEPGEILPETVKRECLEETGIEVEVGELILLREYFLDKGVHGVEFMFSCKFIGERSGILQPDDNQIGIEWIPIQELKKLPLYPTALRESIINYHNGQSLIVYAGEMK